MSYEPRSSRSGESDERTKRITSGELSEVAYEVWDDSWPLGEKATRTTILRLLFEIQQLRVRLDYLEKNAVMETDC